MNFNQQDSREQKHFNITNTSNMYDNQNMLQKYIQQE